MWLRGRSVVGPIPEIPHSDQAGLSREGRKSGKISESDNVAYRTLMGAKGLVLPTRWPGVILVLRPHLRAFDRPLMPARRALLEIDGGCGSRRVELVRMHEPLAFRAHRRHCGHPARTIAELAAGLPTPCTNERARTVLMPGGECSPRPSGGKANRPTQCRLRR
jgi:hypothetical protein